MIRKWISVLLAIIIMFGILGIIPVSVTAQEAEIAYAGADTDVAETGYYDYSTFNSRLDSCKSDYPHGSYSSWQAPSGWYECWAYANQITDRIFGSYGYTWDYHQDRSSIYPGDLIRYGGAYGTGHSIVVTAVDGDTIYYTDRNGTSNYNMVRWGASINRWDIYFISGDKGRQGIYHAPNWDSVIPWVNPISYANMDVNFYVDGRDQANINGIGNIQVYVDGQLQGSGTDFCQDVVVGKYYEVKVNITNSSYHLGGVDTGDGTGLTGTTSSGGTRVRVVIVKDSGGNTDIPNGDYIIASALNQSYGLDIAGDAIPSSNADNLDLWSIGDSPRIQDAFTLTNLGNGYYSIKQKNTNMFIDVQNASTNRFGNIVMCKWNGSNAQQWKICYDSSAGGYTLQPKCSGFYMTVDEARVASGTNILQGLKSSIPKAQGWLFVPFDNKLDVDFYVDGNDKATIDGIGTIQVYVDNQLQKVDGKSTYTDFSQTVKSGKPYEIKVNITDNDYRFVGVETSVAGYTGLTGTTSSDGTKVRVVICKDTGGIQTLADGDYQLLSVLNQGYGLSEKSETAPAPDGTNIELSTLSATPKVNNSFTFTNMGNGYYSIMQKGTNMAVSVEDNSTNRFGNIQIKQWDGSNAQQWKITYDSTVNGYTLQAKCSGFYITVDEAMVASGTNIVQGMKSSIPKAQGWKFRRLLSDDMVNVSDVVMHSNTDEINPEITVVADNKPLVKDVDYQASVTINIEAGKGKVVVSGINNYCNSITKEFAINIVPKILGDADGNGDVDIVDATIIQRHECNMIVPYPIDVLINGDVDGDGELTVLDATFIQRFCSSMKTPYKIGEPIT